MMSLDDTRERESYEYDFFVSYAHVENEKFDPWVCDIFMPLLQTHISSEYKRPVRFFIDKNGIRDGDYWRKTIIEKLKKSRFLIAMCSPGYFRSDWCIAEMNTFRLREKIVLDKNSGKSLITPIIYKDGEYLPDHIREIQSRHVVRDYTFAATYFTKSDKYLEFEELVRDNISKDLMFKLDSDVARYYRNDFPVQEIIETSEVTNIRRPFIE